MEFHLPDNIQKEKRRKRKAIPQIAYSTQNKTEEGRYFNDTSNTIKNPENWKDTLVTKADVENGLVDTRPYKVYTALLTQSGTNAPVATVLENTLGVTITWARNTAGSSITYLGTFSTTLSGSLFVNITSGHANSIAGAPRLSSANIVPTFVIYSVFSNGSTPIDDHKCFLEIRVYP